VSSRITASCPSSAARCRSLFTLHVDRRPFSPAAAAPPPRPLSPPPGAAPSIRVHPACRQPPPSPAAAAPALRRSVFILHIDPPPPSPAAAAPPRRAPSKRPATVASDNRFDGDSLSSGWVHLPTITVKEGGVSHQFSSEEICLAWVGFTYILQRLKRAASVINSAARRSTQLESGSLTYCNS